LWAATLSVLATRIAHDFRNALNGVAVNLEVVRGRSARGAAASDIAPFAATAASQFEAASASAEALLAFARQEPARVDVAAIVHRLVRLLGLRAGSEIRVTDRSDGRAQTRAPGDIVRAAVAQSVLGGLSVGESIACEISVGDGIFLTVTGAMHVPRPDSDLLAIAAVYDVVITSHGQTLELRFPAVDARATPDALA
jgi:hypothetical protein